MRCCRRVCSFVLVLLASAPLPAAPEPTVIALPSFIQDAPLDQDSLVASLLTAIAGREYELAELVFRNVRVLRQIPASRLVGTMQYVYSRALGVDCRHCHDVGRWEQDDVLPKKVAREMITVAAEINNDLIRRSLLLSARRATVSCSTCHRGEPRPLGGPTSKE
jgi:hypothetical protein